MSERLDVAERGLCKSFHVEAAGAGGVSVSGSLMPDSIRRTGMNARQKIKKENPHYTLVQKLHPIRSKMSGVMAVVVGFVLGTTFIEPAIAEIAVTSDGFVLARPEGGEGAPHFWGDTLSFCGVGRVSSPQQDSPLPSSWKLRPCSRPRSASSAQTSPRRREDEGTTSSTLCAVLRATK